VDLYIHSPIRHHGVVLNYLNTGTALLTYFGFRAIINESFIFSMSYVVRRYLYVYTMLEIFWTCETLRLCPTNLTKTKSESE
jgi:uncharacterized membrane protein